MSKNQIIILLSIVIIILLVVGYFEIVKKECPVVEQKQTETAEDKPVETVQQPIEQLNTNPSEPLAIGQIT